jgi:hypothetical protein
MPCATDRTPALICHRRKADNAAFWKLNSGMMDPSDPPRLDTVFGLLARYRHGLLPDAVAVFVEEELEAGRIQPTDFIGPAQPRRASLARTASNWPEGPATEVTRLKVRGPSFLYTTPRL